MFVERIRGVVLAGVCVALVGASGERHALAGGQSNLAKGPQRGADVQKAPQQVKPVIRGAADGKRAWLGAEHRGLVVSKMANRTDGSLAIDLRFRHDQIVIAVERTGGITVYRGGRGLRVSSVESFERLQQMLAGSEVALASRVLLAERESVSELQAAEMSLLSTLAFVASLAGDVDAPRRLSTRFMEKHRGFFRPVRMVTCFDAYSSEASGAWNDMQMCMDEANQDSSMFQRAYRRVACNGIWLLRSESAWIEYLGCLGPGQLLPN